MSKVKLQGRKLILEGTNEVAYQHSSDLLIEMSLADGAASPFYGMLLTATVKTPDKDVVPCPIIEESGKKYILLAEKALATDGFVKLSVGGINDEKIVITSNTVNLCVDESNHVISKVSPNEKYWQIEVRNAIRYWYDTQIKPQYDALKDTVSTLIERDEELQDDIAKTEEAVNKTLSDVNEAIEQSSAAAQNANTATSAASDAAQAASSAANRANDAASDASSAAQSASNIASEVERKLQAGEFIGETGPIGPVGPKGEDGATGLTGPKGDPGSRTLYGSGAPSSSIGSVGDWYYDTGSELWDVYFKSSTGQWTKMGQLKSGGNVPNQNLIINGDFQVWQRGTTVDVAKRSGFAADRWYMSRNEAVRLKTTIKQDNGLCVTFTSAPTSGENVQFDYLVPQETAKEIAGQTVTLSYAGTGDIQVRVRVKNGDNYTDVVSKTKDTAVTFDVPTLTDGDILDIVIYVYNTATIRYVKLESGGVATPLVPRYYSEELMECMRFYQQLTYSHSAYCSTLTSSMHDTLFLKMPMRTMPTITSLTSIPDNNSINVRSINYSYMTGGTVRFSVESSTTGFVRIYNVTIELEAELI